MSKLKVTLRREPEKFHIEEVTGIGFSFYFDDSSMKREAIMLKESMPPKEVARVLRDLADWMDSI